MAGTIALSGSQQLDMDGEPLSGGLLYLFAAGTTTPQSAYQDFALTIIFPNPIGLDASGRIPFFYLNDGFIKIRLEDSSGATVIAADQLLVIGPSSGTGGGGAGVDVTTVLQTGDIKARYGTGTLNGFVRCNGKTIGNSVSSASELASTDLARALYQYLHPFPNIALESATKTTPAADFDAGKRLILPDLRGRTIAGMDDMGAAAAARLTATYFGASGTVLGNAGGDEKRTLTASQIPKITPGGTVGITPSSYTPAGSVAAGSVATIINTNALTVQAPAGGLTNVAVTSGHAGSFLDQTVSQLTSDTVTSGAFTGTAQSFSAAFSGNEWNPTGGGAHATASPAMIMTWYIKL